MFASIRDENKRLVAFLSSKKVQRKRGRAKNRYYISFNADFYKKNETEIDMILSSYNDDFMKPGWACGFKRKTDALKAWTYIMLRFG